MALSLFYYNEAVAEKKITVDSIAPYFAKYELKRAGMKLATVNYSLWRDGDVYVYETSGDPSGIARLFGKNVAREQATFVLIDGNIVQQQFNYTFESGEHRQNRNIKFDWEKGEATIKRRGKETKFKLKDGMVDRLLLQLKVILDLANKKLKPEYIAIGKRKPRSYHFEKNETESVVTPAGTYKTVVMTGIQKRRKGDRVTRYWCAGKLSMLPVKIEQYRNGEVSFEMNLISVRGLKQEADK